MSAKNPIWQTAFSAKNGVKPMISGFACKMWQTSIPALPDFSRKTYILRNFLSLKINF